jgi:hypothetical protein
MSDLDSMDYWGDKHDALLARFKDLQNASSELRSDIRALNFKVSTLEQATGADAAQVIADLRMKLARREEGLRALVRHFRGTVPYKAPEVMDSFLFTYASLVGDLLDSWEEEDASAVEATDETEVATCKVCGQPWRKFHPCIE